MPLNALSGRRVLDLSQYLPGPYATRMLADLGARVLKIEPLAGDPMRTLPPLDADGVSLPYKAINRNKATLRLDLKTAAGREAFERLLRSADVLLESFRPGVLARLGFPKDRVREIAPRLVHCALTGYGQDGPMTATPGHDATYMALMGGLAASGTEAGPVLAFPPVADHAAALHAALCILAALLARENTGRGAFLDVSIAEAVLPWQQFALSAADLEGTDIARRCHTLNGGAACYQVYATKDGRFAVLGAIEEKFWRNFCAAAGRPDWVSRQSEPLPQEALIAELRACFASATLAEWEARLADAECCFQAVTPAGALAAHPQIRARGFLQKATQDGRTFTEVLFPARADGQAPKARKAWREIGLEDAFRAWETEAP
ncbi:MAG: CoA transferase [Pseudomonadota bacterium]